MTVNLFGGFTLTGGSPELQNVLLSRSAFIEAYCTAKGWAEPLSLEQVLEIRSQDGWKHPGKGQA